MNEEDDMNEEDNESSTEWIEATDNQEFELTVFPEETDKSEPFNPIQYGGGGHYGPLQSFLNISRTT